MANQAIKKKTFGPRKSISQIKADMGMQVTEDDLSNSNADKEMEWLVLPEAYESALKLPGVPLGYVTTICGHSNTGKSTLVNCIMAAAQAQGYIPVIYDTENNFDFTYAKDCGFKSTEIYGMVEEEIYDPETGEYKTVRNKKVIGHDGDFIYYNQNILANLYGHIDHSTGKPGTKKRKQAVIEDIAYSINELLDKQDDGEIQQGLVFLWDSVGSITSLKNLNSKVGNNQFDAGVISAVFNNIVNSRIPGSRKLSSTYTNSMILVNKVWMDSMSAPVGPPSMEMKGGKSIFYASRLIIVMGGELKSSIKKLTAIAKGQQYNYGIETKIRVKKNQLPAPYNITYEGTICCVTHGIVSPERLDEYKKKYMPSILKSLQELGAKQREELGEEVEEITEDDINFSEVDDN